MGHLIPSTDHTLWDIFQEMVPGTNRHLISAELIAYLKWLIYVGAYPDRATVDHVEFYQKQVALYQNPARERMWRSLLYQELDKWYKEHPPSKKRRSRGASSGSSSVAADYELPEVDDFIDLLDVAAGARGAGAHVPGVALAAAGAGGGGAPVAGVALAAAAAAALAPAGGQASR